MRDTQFCSKICWVAGISVLCSRATGSIQNTAEGDIQLPAAARGVPPPRHSPLGPTPAFPEHLSAEHLPWVSLSLSVFPNGLIWPRAES